MSTDHATVVRCFNELGYTATFAAVAKLLKCPPSTLYGRYPSREALGVVWMASKVPTAPSANGLGEAFRSLVLFVLQTLEADRDFSRACLLALKLAGPLHLPEFPALHDAIAKFFEDWFEAFGDDVGLPDGIDLEDVQDEITDALCGLVLWFVWSWEMDRSPMYGQTSDSMKAASYLLDALLIRRADFGDNSLLQHIHLLVDKRHEQFLKPLLDLLGKPDRVQRFADPVRLIEVLRNFRPPPANHT